MGDFDANGDGLVDMRIDATAQGIGELRAHADGLSAALTAAFSRINELGGRLGKGGQLSDRFMAEYTKWRNGTGPVCVADPAPGATSSVQDDPGLDKGVSEVPVNYRKIVESGDAAVTTYRNAEQNAARGFRY
ncbi:hypothetical protein [Actinophytocola sp. KF-1]